MLYKYLIATIFLFTSMLAIADDNSRVQMAIENEYGACYPKFQENLEHCLASSCVYPDLSGAKAWKAHIVRGMVNDKCYVIYYSYIGNNIIGEPLHCFYNSEQLKFVSKLYRDLFTTIAAFDVPDLKSKIAQVNAQACQIKK